VPRQPSDYALSHFSSSLSKCEPCKRSPSHYYLLELYCPDEKPRVGYSSRYFEDPRSSREVFLKAPRTKVLHARAVRLCTTMYLTCVRGDRLGGSRHMTGEEEEQARSILSIEHRYTKTTPRGRRATRESPTQFSERMQYTASQGYVQRRWDKRCFCSPTRTEILQEDPCIAVIGGRFSRRGRIAKHR
jgi:hypothetical protein